MQNLHIGSTVRLALSKATGKNLKPDQKAGRFQAYAPPLKWGPQVEIFAQFGVVGPNRDEHITKVKVHFDTQSQASSPFEVKITGGDQTITTAGPGSALVTITGNVATALNIRCKSYSLGQNVIVTV